MTAAPRGRTGLSNGRGQRQRVQRRPTAALRGSSRSVAVDVRSALHSASPWSLLLGVPRRSSEWLCLRAVPEESLL